MGLSLYFVVKPCEVRKFREEIHVDVIWSLRRQRRYTVRDHVYLHSFLPVTLDEGFWIVLHSGRFIPG